MGVITVRKQTIYKYGWQAGNGVVRYSYWDSINKRTRLAFVTDRICYPFERSRKRIHPRNSSKIVIAPYIYFTVNNRRYRTLF